MVFHSDNLISTFWSCLNELDRLRTRSGLGEDGRTARTFLLRSFGRDLRSR